VIIESGVTRVGNEAFSTIRSLENLTLNYGLTQIGSNAFSRSGLTGRLTIPDSVTLIEQSAFSGTDISDVTLPVNKDFIRLQDFVFCYTPNLTNVNIPDSVISIGTQTFLESGLTSITIPASVTFIATNAFMRSGLTSVDIPDGITRLIYGVFAGTKLTNVTIPANVTQIEAVAFYDIPTLTSVTFLGAVPPSLRQSHVFGGTTPTDLTVYVPVGTAEAYRAIPQLSDFNIVETFGTNPPTGVVGIPKMTATISVVVISVVLWGLVFCRKL
jgi:hypothetical protein